MSTPITHNALFILGWIGVLEKLSVDVDDELQDEGDDIVEVEIDFEEAVIYDLVKECVALYNYPDAVQAIRRNDGNILSRRVTHFESAKMFGTEPNWHNLFSPEFLEVVKETDVVSWDTFHDTADQDGDVMGQYTDWYAWRQAKQEYQLWASQTGNTRAMLLAELVGAHLEIADWLNDQMFRKYVTMLDDGSIMIGRAKFGPEEKKTAFGLFKNLLMGLQELSAVDELESIFDDVTMLNEAIEASYRETYSPWLANNSLKFVKKFSYEDVFSPSYEMLQLLAKAGLSLEDIEYETDELINRAAALTSGQIMNYALQYTSFWTEN